MSPKFVLVLGFLFALSLAVLADTSTGDQTDAIEPQQSGRGGCRYGCCGHISHSRSSYSGRCSYCCRGPTKTASGETANERNTMEPQKRGGSGCRNGCCGSYAYGQCSACCPPSKKTTTEETTVQTNMVEPQQRSGCRRGCCGSYAYGQCSYCCPRKMEKNEEAEAKP